ncbi:type I-E CRISPR-associated protein Cse2/CasB [Actinomadura kijaniata]|uniref:type I-E CRISPR-associated protein Cse2/CasB n=1 Tax=Actinomadura kijaniata TaxID=46161 RepID=UPI003F1BFB05
MTHPIDREHRHAERFVTHVHKRIARSSGDRAALRRALRRDPAHPSARAAHGVISWSVPVGADAAVERAYYTVASLIASQPRKARDGEPLEDESSSSEPETSVEPTVENSEGAWNALPALTSLGCTLGEATALGKLKFDTTEARLHLLCRQGVDGIHRHLPRLIAQLRADLVPVDWTKLLLDLSRWGRDRDHITKQWLQDFYRTNYKITAARRKQNDADSTDSPESEDQ